MTFWGISFFIMNIKETTLQFVENVLGEICALFPGKYVHIGGDEVKTN